MKLASMPMKTPTTKTKPVVQEAMPAGMAQAMPTPPAPAKKPMAGGIKGIMMKKGMLGKS